MLDDAKFPKSLLEASRYFDNPDVCVEFVAAMRWPEGPVCPHCGGKEHSFLKTRRIWKCKACRKQFSVKTASIFEDSPIALDKWLIAIWLVVNCKNGVSSYEIMRDLKVTQKSAWFMLHRIRLALKNSSFEKMGGKRGGGPVEMDEAFIGGNPQRMHAARRNKLRLGEKRTNKTAVFGMLDRDTRQVRAKVVPDVKRDTLMNEILENVVWGSTVYTDDALQYQSLKVCQFVRETVNHVEEYVRGEVHTQGIENFWSLLKRGLRGTYVAVEPFHLDAYVDEQVFRFNNRATKDNPLDDMDRFMLAVSQISGKRLTYAELTGKAEQNQPL
ncbi:MAG TPA: IS1595 family transposase [Acidobacteriaceae bacterium]|jgi:transposase-like protein|nr:IS1595 family transposase [Acidobacteriaceae bacterium]